MTYNIRNAAIRWQIHDLLFNGNSTAFLISHHLKNAKRLTLKMKVKVKGVKTELASFGSSRDLPKVRQK